MPVVGTAGHVDHGKSTLLRALTGRDPDRWAEEKRRGLTIDLGFTWMTLPSGTEVSFVDVPGHQRYARNMLAGIEAIDLALVVVAADEGWMPQTEEHLAILDLFGIHRGIVVISKIDLVDEDLGELASLEAEEMIAGTSLQDSPIIGVSAHTGAGVDELISAMDGFLEPPVTSATGTPRMWIDRAFAITGAGTVVTGTLQDGSVELADELTAWPGGDTVRVRSIESHEQRLQRVAPHTRVALNLSGADVARVGRGTMLSRAGEWDPTESLIGRLSPVARSTETPERGSFQLHIGSAWASMSMRRLEDDLYLVRLDRPLPLRVTDRFAVRDSGRQAVVAGGVVLDPGPGRRPRRSLATLRTIDTTGDSSDIAQAILEARGRETLARLRAHTGGLPQRATVIDEAAYSDAEISRMVDAISAMVDRFHEDRPLRVGMPLSQVASTLGVSTRTVEAVTGTVETLTVAGPHLAHTGHIAHPTPAEELQWNAARERLVEAGLAVPRVSELGLGDEHLHYLLRTGRLVRVSEDFTYLPEQVAHLKALLGSMDQVFALADVREATSLSRLHLIPILEWSDREGITIRDGDIRRLR
jgi:selenocysteine-specific elongation factor